MSNDQILQLVGGAILAFGMIILIIRILFIRRAVTTQGTVTDLESHHDREGGSSYSPVVTFSTPDGQSHQFSSNVASQPPAYQVGERVPVKYLANNPQRAKIGTPGSLWLLPAIFVAIGAGLLIWSTLFKDDEESAAQPAANVPSLARDIREGQTRITVVNQSESRVLISECVSIRDTQEGTLGITREVQLRLEGDKTLTFKATPYTGPKAYTVPIGASVGGSIFEGVQSLSGAVVFSGSGQNGVVNLSAPPLSVLGNWGCAAVELQRS
jgi:hypothetical protein